MACCDVRTSTVIIRRMQCSPSQESTIYTIINLLRIILLFTSHSDCLTVDIANNSFGAGRTVKDIKSGDEHTCVILDNDKVLCYGNGNAGRLVSCYILNY
jgi:Regulator of chromosome condensation (RCC1) repeat